jgi:hypothetical protein
MADLILKHAAGTRADDYDVIVDGQVVGYIMLSDAAPADTPWIWTLASDFYENRTLTSGYEATREAAIQRSPGVGIENAEPASQEARPQLPSPGGRQLHQCSLEGDASCGPQRRENWSPVYVAHGRLKRGWASYAE